MYFLLPISFPSHRVTVLNALCNYFSTNLPCIATANNGRHYQITVHSLQVSLILCLLTLLFSRSKILNIEQHSLRLPQ